MIEEVEVERVGEVISQGSLEQITRAEIDMQVATAKRYPRSVEKFVKDARAMAIRDPETAASCFYKLPRDGKVIEGPSVRLAEIVASCWGNIRSGSRVIQETDKFIVAQGVCHDTEKNVYGSSEVRRRITTKAGKRYGDDMLITASNAACSIAGRNAIFKVVPRSYVQAILEECMRVARGDEKTLGIRRDAAVKYFVKEQKIPMDKLLAKLSAVASERMGSEISKRGVEDIDLDDLEFLTGIRTAIKDGEATAFETFMPREEPATVVAETKGGKINLDASKPGVPVDPPGGSQVQSSAFDGFGAEDPA